MQIEWDELKSKANLEKHAIDFARASALFDGRPNVTRSSNRPGEERNATTGEIDTQFVSVIWTWRSDFSMETERW